MPFDPNSYNKTPDDPERDIKRENGSKTLAAIEAANKAAVDRYKKAVEQYNEGLKENERLKAELARLEGGAPDSAPDPNPDQNPDPDPDPDLDLDPDLNPSPNPNQAPVGIREKFHKVLANPTVKKVLTGAAIVAITASLVYSAIQKKNANLLGDTTSGQSLTGSRPAVSDTLNPTGSQDNKDFQDDPEELNPIEAIGILNKYDDYGKWCSKNKSSDVNFACAAEVAEVCENDPTKMVKYTADGQVEALSDYMPFLPQQLLPEGFRDLSIIKMEHYLESLPDAAFDSAQYQIFNKIMDQAKTRPYFANGWHDNAFMRHENPDPDAPIVHEDMELVRCTTYENHKEYLEFYWEDDDGNEIGSMPVRMSPVRDEQGNIIGWEGCMQVITPSGTSIYEGLPEIPAPTPTPTPTPAPTPTPTPETPAPKDYDNLIRIDENINNDIAEDIHTGSIEISQTEDVNTTTPETTQPTASEYTGTEPTIVVNEAAEEAEPIGEGTSTSISPENDYSTDLGGANAGNAEENPVQPNEEGQAAANEAAEAYNEYNTPHAPGYGSEDNGTSTGEGGSYYTIDDLLNP